MQPRKQADNALPWTSCNDGFRVCMCVGGWGRKRARERQSVLSKAVDDETYKVRMEVWVAWMEEDMAV